MDGEMCFESPGQWWWFPVLLGTFFAGVFAVVLLVKLWTEVIESEVPEPEPSRARGAEFFRRAGPFVPLVLLGVITLNAVKRDGWQGAREVVFPIGVFAVMGLVFLVALTPVAGVVEMRQAALEAGRRLDATEVGRLTRARWGAGAVLVVSAVAFVAALAMFAAKTSLSVCPG